MNLVQTAEQNFLSCACNLLNINYDSFEIDVLRKTVVSQINAKDHNDVQQFWVEMSFYLNKGSGILRDYYYNVLSQKIQVSLNTSYFKPTGQTFSTMQPVYSTTEQYDIISDSEFANVRSGFQRLVTSMDQTDSEFTFKAQTAYTGQLLQLLIQNKDLYSSQIIDNDANINVSMILPVNEAQNLQFTNEIQQVVAEFTGKEVRGSVKKAVEAVQCPRFWEVAAKRMNKTVKEVRAQWANVVE
ncbi:Hypothetical_protein [Hexamita inflata]|uniref:Hypothetical_protein n=1 Tax=Hexamita inflata TaxID=28002 RepID=A0ABP1GJI8_9EUKA